MEIIENLKIKNYSKIAILFLWITIYSYPKYTILPEIHKIIRHSKCPPIKKNQAKSYKLTHFYI
ncbi:hypothetical protein, partial [Sulfuricurvum sp.]|uniref:hypothetical protein n=1 Tax=Sulfuricurvum sp. TaxID=2025608 RepID=UPI002618BED4